MTSRAEAEKAIAGLLRDHRDMTNDVPRLCRCKCGVRICLEGEGMSHDWHYAEHVASVIAGYMADVWEQGAEWAGAIRLDGSCGAPGQNPYRDEGNQP